MALYHYQCDGQVIRTQMTQELLGGVRLPTTQLQCTRCGSTNPAMYEADRPLGELALILSNHINRRKARREA